ncbi:hypothetical protein [Algibacter sp. L4_22]|uniref:hypothetical protein n=1 Tax=Algibacter sp. L4_22 TaxID=2942477 RepID=UPI00201B814D|nr:hypothetical protein [Algibacter sp. L4_22]MCL5128064.1 hypothetical protein [Algibacter sp. L4_22]
MKNEIFLIILIFSLNLSSQNLIGTKWLKINAERKDGSVIHDRLNTKNSFTEYHFKSIDKITINSIKPAANYKIKDSELTVGNQKYTIEKLTDTELIICEKGEINITDDKKNRLYFIESKKLINYLIKNNLLTFLNDSTIKAKKYLEPKLKENKDLSTIISKSLKKKNFSTSKDKKFKQGYLIGEFHINTLGKIDSVEIKQNIEIFKIIENRLIKELKKIDFIPVEIGKKYNHVVDFVASFTRFSGMYGISINTNTNEISSRKGKNLSIKDKDKSLKLYNEGIFDFTKKNYIEAIDKFNEVTKIDSLYFDAYYNRAYTNLIINNNKKSCIDWEYLKKMGQKEGERLYNQKCK